jgi:hypothetical protein
VRCEDGCTRLNGTFNYKIIGKEGVTEDLQWIQVLVPVCHLSLNPNVYGLRRCLRVGYSNEELSLEERIFLDTWDVISSKD